jgi:hypothetical protein
MGASKSKVAPHPHTIVPTGPIVPANKSLHSSSTLLNFKAAGTMFISETHVLCGYQPNKQNPGITGIGGTRIALETYTYCAIRETLEELFDITPHETVISIIAKNISPIHTMKNNNYVCVVYTFAHLNMLLKICKQMKVKSPIYDNFPTSLHQLIFDRKPTPSSEIKHLTILPLHIKNPTVPLVLEEFISDLKIVARTIS